MSTDNGHVYFRGPKETSRIVKYKLDFGTRGQGGGVLVFHFGGAYADY